MVTSQGWITRGAVDKLISRYRKPDFKFTDCEENPTIQTVINVSAALNDVDVYVALGGGSVIDALNGAAVLCAGPYFEAGGERKIPRIDQ